MIGVWCLSGVCVEQDRYDKQRESNDLKAVARVDEVEGGDSGRIEGVRWSRATMQRLRSV